MRVAEAERVSEASGIDADHFVRELELEVVTDVFERRSVGDAVCVPRLEETVTESDAENDLLQEAIDADRNTEAVRRELLTDFVDVANAVRLKEAVGPPLLETVADGSANVSESDRSSRSLCRM